VVEAWKIAVKDQSSAALKQAGNSKIGFLDMAAFERLRRSLWVELHARSQVKLPIFPGFGIL
jgi:hypothetical protein